MNNNLEIYKRLELNPMLFGETFFPNHFRYESAPFQLKIVLEAMKNKYLAVVAPRGSSKSTILSFLMTVHAICFRRKHFVLMVQNTYSKAAGSLEGIKAEFKYNQDLKKSFGISLRKDAEGDTIFTHKDGYEVRVLCKGSEQIGTVRGEKFREYRPDLIIGDDLEDDEQVKNPERRLALKDDFDNALTPSGDAHNLNMIVIGTVLHDDSFISKLVSPNDYPEYKKLFFKARYLKDGVKTSLWPPTWSIEMLDKLEAEKPLVFAKEYQGDPSQGGLETIRREDFRYWREEDNYILLLNTDGSIKSKYLFSDCRAAIGTDLAWEIKKGSDDSAIVPGIITPGNDLLIDDYVNKKGLRPDELENILFDMSSKYEKRTGKRVTIGFEKAKLEKVSKWFLSEAQRRRNQWLLIKDVSWGTLDKVERIMNRLGNRYAQHAVYHKKGMGLLENQLVRLRSTAHDDIADAVGMLPELLQFAPKKKATIPKDDFFKLLQKHTPGYQEKSKSEYQFGLGTREIIKSKEALPV